MDMGDTENVLYGSVEDFGFYDKVVDVFGGCVASVSGLIECGEFFYSVGGLFFDMGGMSVYRRNGRLLPEDYSRRGRRVLWSRRTRVRP